MSMELWGLPIGFAMALAATASAQTAYPTRPVSMIVPLPAGSAVNGLARIVLPAAGKFLSQPIIIKNEGGATSIPGTTRAAKAAADGYTLLWATVATQVSNPNMFKDLPCDPARDFTAVARVGGQSMIMAVPTASTIDSVADYIDHARQVGNLRYASAGIGTSAHLCAKLPKLHTGIRLRHIPYQGDAQPALDLMRGETSVMFYSLAQFQPGLQSGELKLLGIASEQRSKFTPDLPTMRELGYCVVLTSWYGVYARRCTPPEVADKITDAISKVLQQPDVIAALERTGTDLHPNASPAEYEAFTESERTQYGALIAAAGIPRT